MNSITYFLYLGERFIESTSSQFKAIAFIKAFPNVSRIVIAKAPNRFYGSHTDFKTDLVIFVAFNLEQLDEISSRKEL